MKMKRIITAILCLSAALAASAQTVQDVAAQAAMAAAETEMTVAAEPKPQYWATDLKTQINVGQTSLTNWAAGGDNTVSLAAFIDANANWQKDEMFWNNRLQLDYGFLYASSKPILQKSTDRIYLESKWGYKTEKMKNLYFSANYDFKSQFTTGYDYKTPSVPTADPSGNPYPDGTELDNLDRDILKQLWKDARVNKSGFLAPAYTNLALGIDYKPFNWLSINFAPLTGGYVIVRNEEYRKAYSMNLKPEWKDYDALSDTQKKEFDDAMASKNDALIGSFYQGARFEFGAQLKMDAGFSINDNFKYTTQVVLFYNYLAGQNEVGGKCPRINWDNRIDWKLAKYFSFTITTNLIYDDTIMILNDKDLDAFPEGKARVQFKESLAFGFTWTIANKK